MCLAMTKTVECPNTKGMRSLTGGRGVRRKAAEGSGEVLFNENIEQFDERMPVIRYFVGYCLRLKRRL